MSEPATSPRGLPLRHPAALIATAFGVGLLPVAPGTWASLATLPLAWLLDHFAGRGSLVVAGIVIAAIGVWASQVYVAHHRVQDPGEIVVDEVAAQLLTLAAVPLTWFSLIAGFLLFRLFDIVKPWPVSWADRKVKGGLGVMLDDLLAAGYAALCLVLLLLLKDTLIHVS
jgi:phosphatidylglycerophosphatase A